MKVEPAAAIRGAIAVPGVKGISQRAVLLAALADGQSRIRGFGRAADTESAIDVVRALGVSVADGGGDEIRVEGVGLRGLRAPACAVDCGNAGTVMRLVAGILAAQEGTFELVGDESLSARPQERIARPLREMGARVETTDGHAPVLITGARLEPIRYELPVASAQVKSAILLAGLLAEQGPTTVIEPVATRDHTERLLQTLGVRVERGPHDVSVWPVDVIRSLDLDIAGEFSSAAPFIVAAAVLAGSELVVQGVNVNATRTGLLDVLGRMGARVTVFNRRTVGGEPVGDIEVRSAPLVATTVGADDVPSLVDELPLVALAASFARGRSEVRGAEELRHKETDRIDAVVDELRRIGVRIEARPDGFVVNGVPARPRGGHVDARGDHRIAMLAAVAAVASREGVEIEGADCVAISFPGFFDLLAEVAQRTSDFG
jgi:3-phosphoshikimate 1-carboxyvinyltransferase